ncbi:MAG: undecaprenyl-phosphate glucose phosphotransferase [Acidobacteria bacterium]|jgi:Undecaprenyl-phosphate glucose phosphotransferase|nr:undecaprenyl-phosphate glucose phosphotransferase [Acidobacteriota bacterium]
MVKRFGRLFVLVHVLADIVAAAAAFVLAYVIRFQTGLIESPKGQPPLDQYLSVLPFVALMVPVAFHVQRLYRLRRGRTRMDDFFAVLVGSLLTVLLALVGTLYVQTYHLGDALKAQGYLEVSQWVWVIFLGLNVVFTFTTREVVRSQLRRRWRKGVGLRRVLIVGAGDLGRLVADRILEHRELGFRLVGFVDDRFTTTDPIGYRGLPILGSLGDTVDACTREQIDEIYVALPLDEHVKMLNVVEMASRECIEIHVVPDLLQFLALRARLEDLDGLPIISINDMPLRGFNSLLKRSVDIAFSTAVLVGGLVPALIVALIIKRSAPGPVFYTQERMGLDGKSFTVYKFRSMPIDAEEVTGPIWARDDDPRATAVGRWLRKTDVDELPQFWNVFRGDMSIVGPRPERPFFVEQFKHQIPQYMLRHKVKAGITGWAQVNGWRGNTSLEKRIEFDLYYIENWSLSLDMKIMWLTVMRGIHRAAY